MTPEERRGRAQFRFYNLQFWALVALIIIIWYFWSIDDAPTWRNAPTPAPTPIERIASATIR